MKIYQSVLTYILLFLLIAVVLKFFGLIHLSGSEIIGYALICYGICSVYLSLGKNRKFTLFFGTIFFLAGVLLFIINNFPIFWNNYILLPSFLFTTGIAFLMLFIDRPEKRKFFITSLVFIAAGLIFTIISGQFSFPGFYDAIVKISSYYWPVALAAAGILILVFFEERK